MDKDFFEPTKFDEDTSYLDFFENEHEYLEHIRKIEEDNEENNYADFHLSRSLVSSF